MNRDLKLFFKWVRDNQLSLNTSKTSLWSSNLNTKKLYFNLPINRQKIQHHSTSTSTSSSIKYLEVILQNDLHQTTYLVNLKKKLSRSIGLLSNIRHYVLKNLLRRIHYSLFNSHLIYAREIWGQSQTNQLFQKLYYSYKKKL